MDRPLAMLGILERTVGIVIHKIMNSVAEVVELLSRQDYDEQDMTKVLPCVPNISTDDVTLLFSGWKIVLKPDGTWIVKDTSK
jgi:hypothetical protein